MTSVVHGTRRGQGRGANMRRRAAVMLGVLSLAALAPPASAGIITGQSAGYDVSANVTLTLLNTATVTATAGPTPMAQGTAPPAYSNSATLASLSVAAGSVPLGNLLTINTGLLNAAAASTVNGGSGPRTTSASSSVDNLSIGLLPTPNLPLLPPISLLGLGATTITSQSSVTGDFGSLGASGNSVIENLSLSVLGLPVALSVGPFAPNTSVPLLALIGASLVLNEQIVTGDGVSARGITTNAIHLRLNNVGVAGVGTLNGDIIIAHSDASMTAQRDQVSAVAAPEPASMALIGLGTAAAGLGGWTRRRFRPVTGAAPSPDAVC